MPVDETVVSAFAAALGSRDAVATDAATLAGNAKDRWIFGHQPGLVPRPHTRDEVVAIVKVAGEHNVSLVTRGAASNCSAGFMAGSDRMEQLAQHKLVFSPDPVSAHLAAIGGNIVENAGGPNALKYGAAYNHVLSVEAVLADGSLPSDIHATVRRQP
ncbi:hypothetical protein CG716_25500 [Mycolicibacterium sphagni]|uniref:FAD linked oxidase N-terminal domain-containing protein n=1 Tax=Mycolicibacterium sphagni TaxID=1786 RepID=A0A255DDU1_9MYCO|nr:hypothetical protein CG716_25500 [Mycolicibacterium sphagni]